MNKPVENIAGAYQSISVRPLAGALGAEVGGVNLATLEDEAV